MSNPPNNPTPTSSVPANPSASTPANQKSVVARAKVTREFSGPIPPPELLAHYNTIVPGAADRILKMAEEDAKHLQTMERIGLIGAQSERRLGQIFGLSIGVTALLASVLCAWLGHPTTASVIGGTTVVGLVTVFIVGRTIKPPQDSN